MSRYFMQLAYLGAPFHGWQSQPGEVTVQSTLENALSILLRTPTAVVGAGRTDAGVNARPFRFRRRYGHSRDAARTQFDNGA